MPPEAISFWVDYGGIIPIHKDGAPADRELFELNYQFAVQFQQQEFKEASKLLRHMKKRVEAIEEKMEADAIAVLTKFGYKFN